MLSCDTFRYAISTFFLEALSTENGASNYVAELLNLPQMSCVVKIKFRLNLLLLTDVEPELASVNIW